MSAALPDDAADREVQDPEPMRLTGSSLEPEEMAALTAVLAQMRAQGGAAVPQAGRSRRLRRPDRRRVRRRDLGRWARPGEAQWRRAAGRR